MKIGRMVMFDGDKADFQGEIELLTGEKLRFYMWEHSSMMGKKYYSGNILAKEKAKDKPVPPTPEEEEETDDVPF